jgi:hypothetical protein
MFEPLVYVVALVSIVGIVAIVFGAKFIVKIRPDAVDLSSEPVKDPTDNPHAR